VSKVTDMKLMFYEAKSFKQVLCGAAWVNSKAEQREMFLGSPGYIHSDCSMTLSAGVVTSKITPGLVAVIITIGVLLGWPGV